MASETKPTRKATSKQRPERVRAIEGDTNEYGTVYDKPGGHITGFWFPSDEWATDSMRSVTLGIMLIKHGADEALRIDAAARPLPDCSEQVRQQRWLLRNAWDEPMPGELLLPAKLGVGGLKEARWLFVWYDSTAPMGFGQGIARYVVEARANSV